MAKKRNPSHQYLNFALSLRNTLLIFSVILILALPIIVFAQTGATVRTRVGNVQQADIIQAGLDLKAAYDACNNGFTYGNIASCLRENLSSKGYSDDILNAFEPRRSGVPGSGGTGTLVGNPPCTQCLGYVGLVLGLATGDFGALTYNRAADVSRLDSFIAGGETWRRISPLEAQPGDIAAHGRNTDGHIFIVIDVAAGGVRLTALESNGNSDCRVTDNRAIINDELTIFRRG